MHTVSDTGTAARKIKGTVVKGNVYLLTYEQWNRMEWRIKEIV